MPAGYRPDQANVGFKMGSAPMDAAPNAQNEDSTERVADVTQTWESSLLTEPELATDQQAKSPADPGFTDDSESDLQRDEDRAARTDH